MIYHHVRQKPVATLFSTHFVGASTTSHARVGAGPLERM